MPKSIKSLAQHFFAALPRALKPGVAAALCALWLGAPSTAAAATHTAPDAAILESVAAWAQAWSAKDAERYLAFYAPAFKPPGGQARAAWEKQRLARITAPRFIEVSTSDLKVLRRDDARAAASFRQRYRSDRYQDETNKTLEFIRDGERWLIVEERVDSVAPDAGAAVPTAPAAESGVSTALGTLHVRSSLGQPLRAEVEVGALKPGEQGILAVRLASPDAYRQAGIEFIAALNGVNMSIQRRDGKPFIAVTTDRPVNEPFLKILIELESKSGRLVREYTVLLDPPTDVPRAPAVAVMAPTAPAAAAPPPSAAPPVAPPVAQPTAPPPPRSEGRRIAEGRIRSQGDPAAPAAPKARVKLAGAEARKPEVAAAASADDREAHARAMKDVQSRINELEKSAADLAKLVEIRNLQIAALERRAAETPPAPAVAPVAKPAVEAPKPAIETPRPAVEAPKPAPGPKPAAKPRPAPPPPAPERSLLEEYLEDPVMLGGLGVVLLLLAGYGAYAWRQKKRAALAQLGARPPAMPVATVSDPGVAAAVDMRSAAAAAAAEEIDPLAEADVYMAYGRDGQAEEILRKALQEGEARPVVYLKLLQIYAKRQETQKFEAEARKLKGLVNSEGPEWDKALALGRSIDPRNALYGQGEGAEVAAAADSAELPKVDFDLDTMMEPAPRQSPAPAAAPASADSILDFDLGGTTGETPVVTKAAAPSASEMDLSTISLDLDEVKSAAKSAGGRDKKWQDVAVKLDVAIAYQEMGDNDGARELLNEVLQEGDAAQQAQAKQILASLA